jgi:hypothetical protein
MTEKRAINIQITDLDDRVKVFLALEKLFKTILDYYLTKQTDDLEIFILSASYYFGTLLKWIGYNESDFKNE